MTANPDRGLFPLYCGTWTEPPPALHRSLNTARPTLLCHQDLAYRHLLPHTLWPLLLLLTILLFIIIFSLAHLTPSLIPVDSKPGPRVYFRYIAAPGPNPPLHSTGQSILLDQRCSAIRTWPIDIYSHTNPLLSICNPQIMELALNDRRACQGQANHCPGVISGPERYPSHNGGQT